MPNSLWSDLCQRLATEDDAEKFDRLIDELFLRLEEKERELKSRKNEETFRPLSAQFHMLAANARFVTEEGEGHAVLVPVYNNYQLPSVLVLVAGHGIDECHADLRCACSALRRQSCCLVRKLCNASPSSFSSG